MSLKGTYKVSQFQMEKRGRKKTEKVIDTLPQSLRTRCQSEYIFDSDRGWMQPCQIIFDTCFPLPGIRNLGAMIYSGKDLPLQAIRYSLTIECLVKAINDYFQILDMHVPVSVDDLEKVRVCPHDLNFWLIGFRKRDDGLHPMVREAAILSDQGDGGNQGSKGEGAGTVNVVMPDDITGHISPIQINWNSHIPIRVGIVDRGAMEPLPGGALSHAGIIGEIIKVNSPTGQTLVEPVACPMVQEYDEIATVFDMISALSNRSILDTVQVINLSQGFYAPTAHRVLQKVIQRLEKPVICSAGNDGSDNDIHPHWPSNFFTEVDSVISVAALQKEGFWQSSNFGRMEVTLSALGQFGEVAGTSYAAAWMSRMVAMAFSLRSRIDLNLDYIVETLEKYNLVSQNNPDRTFTGLRFMT